MRLLLTLSIVLASLMTQQAAASTCSCIADPFSKKYQLFEETWFGTRRHWSCEYTCTGSSGTTQKIVGYHKDWYMTDKGLEGICDGLIYKNIYTPYMGNFVWTLDRAATFNPKRASSDELKRFAQTQCQ
ncbi:MAG: hypothetical protein ACLGGX_01340 [Bdellovibrionia bacterium]